MKLSNFVMIAPLPTSINGTYKAKVDVTKGILWWKKTRRVKICRNAYEVFWFFENTGKWCPGLQAEKLSRAWAARHNVRLY